MIHCGELTDEELVKSHTKPEVSIDHQKVAKIKTRLRFVQLWLFLTGKKHTLRYQFNNLVLRSKGE